MSCKTCVISAFSVSMSEMLEIATYIGSTTTIATNTTAMMLSSRRSRPLKASAQLRTLSNASATATLLLLPTARSGFVAPDFDDQLVVLPVLDGGRDRPLLEIREARVGLQRVDEPVALGN